MKVKELKKILSEMKIDTQTISINTEDDLEFGRCDLSGEDSLLYKCSALTLNGELIDIEVSEDLVGGAFGKIAGYF